jgi:ParB-like chromosome segregation protein Spo0J
VIRDLTDLELLLEKGAENRNRLDPTPFELGIFWHRLLKNKDFTGQRPLAEHAKVSPATVNRYLKFAELPPEVVAVFRDPREIRVEWLDALLQACESNLPRVLEVCHEFREKPANLAITVFHRLIGRAKESSEVITTPKRTVVAWTRKVNGCRAYVLKKEAPKELIEALDNFLLQWTREHGEEIDLDAVNKTVSG